MSNGNVFTCTGTFYDNNGFGNYSPNQDLTQTFCSNIAGQCMRANFSAFSTEANFDRLFIYDGNSTSSALIGTYSGTTPGSSPGMVTGNTGCLTFRFTSDNSAQFGGWTAALSCVTCPSCTGTTPACALPDECVTACDLGTLASPTCSTTGSNTFCLTNTNATAPTPYNALTGCTGGPMPSPAADVWYKIRPGANTNILSFNVTGSIQNPAIGVYEGSACNNLVGRSCATGSGNAASLTLSQVNSASTYYIQISGGNVTDTGKFQLRINSIQDCNLCLQNNSMTVSPLPVNGSFQDGQTVRFCFTVNGYSPTNRNFLHGVIPTFGPGWDTSTLTITPADIPASCLANGQWRWYDTMITSNSSGIKYGPGFFYNQSGGDTILPFYPAEFNPGDNFGDNNFITGECDAHSWTFCWSIATKNCPPGTENQSLNITVNTTADSESGTWSSTACAGDPDYTFFGTLACCSPPSLALTDATCSASDGKAVVTPSGTGPYYYTYQNSSNVTIRTANNRPGVDSITGLAAGNYTVTVIDTFNSCRTTLPFTISTTGGSNPVSVTISPSANNVCAGTSVTFTAAAVNGGSTPVYQWFRNGNPVGTNSSTFTPATLNNGDQVFVRLTSNIACPTGNPDSSNVVTMVINPALPVSVTVSPSANPICTGQSVTFTATPTNGGPTPVYQWFLNGNPVGANSPTYTNSALNNGDQVYVRLTSNATCATGSPATSGTVTMTVTGSLPVSVSISPSANPICSGQSVTFTATPMNGGATPSYQWYRNGNPVGGNNPTYTSSALNNGDQVYVVLTSSSGCATGNPATSNTVVMSVSGALPVTVSIAAAPGNTICAGTSVTFTATPANEGSSPTYQWFLNGNPVGANSPTYTNAALVTGDRVRVRLTSSSSCATGSPANSNIITMTVNPAAPVSVSISPSSNPICAGASVTFTATPVNGGSSPVYQWFLNGNPVGTNSATYTNGSLVNGDQIYVQLTSNAACATGSPATSNTVTITVSGALPVSVSIAPSANPVCAGTPVTFTATPVNGGSTPAYQWYRNGNPVGTNSPSFTPAILNNGDQVYVRLTSNAGCATGNPATSNTIVMTVNPAAPVSVSISPSANPICPGTPVTFTASPNNGGSNPIYQWFLNGNPVGTNSTTYSNSALNNNDQILVQLTSDAACATGNPATSNTVTMTVSGAQPVSVSIAPDANPVCAGTAVTFTATPVNGGSSPVYQWFLNGNPVGANSPTYTGSSLATGDQVSVQLTSNIACATGNPATSNTVTMTVDPSVPVSVSISPSANSICAGTAVTFTATPVNGGSSPVYQWFVNGNPVGSNSPTFTSSAFANGDQVTVQLTSNANCASGSPATSNTVVMIVGSASPASVSITESANPICAGTAVTFTATPVNGGSSPSYAWSVNGSAAGTNSPTFTSSTLGNGDQVLVSMTSNAACVTGSPAVSNLVIMVVNAAQPVSVTIAPDANNICAGTPVNFTASPNNGGSNPAYQWYLNGSAVGTNNATYSNSALNNGDQIFAVLTSNIACPAGNPDTSNIVTMSVISPQPVSVTIAADEDTICSGTAVVFTATPVNGGTPSYQWFLNGNPVGTNSPTYTNSTLNTGDQVTVGLLSSLACITGNPATSNTVVITVNSYPVVDLGPDSTVCAGQTVLLDAGNAGASFLWNTGETTQQISVDTSGTFIASVDANGCAANDTVIITVDPAITPNLGPDRQLCSGTTDTLETGVVADTYAWNTGDSTATLIVDSSGTYSVVVIKGVCRDSAAVTVTFDLFGPGPVDLGPDSTICMDESYLLDATQTGMSYTWHDSSTNSTFFINGTGVYSVQVYNLCGREGDSVNITVEDCLCGVYVPSGFSPNGDGNNDILRAIATCDIANFEMKVFNRWYETVFESNLLSSGWDGTFNGESQPVDTYIYYVSYIDLRFSKQIVQKGVVTLLR